MCILFHMLAGVAYSYIAFLCSLGNYARYLAYRSPLTLRMLVVLSIEQQ
jgi:hypothetical protein